MNQDFVTWAAITACLVLSLGQYGDRSAFERERARFMRTQGLPATPATAALVNARFGHTADRSMQWGLVGFGLGLLLSLIAMSLRLDDYIPVLMYVPSLMGIMIGRARGAARTDDFAGADAPRVARTRAVSIVDYLPTEERLADVCAFAAVGVCAATGVVAWFLLPVHPGADWGRPTALVLVALCSVVVMAVVLRSAGALLNRPQHAHTDLELAWDDALRSFAVRRTHDVARLIGLFSIVLILGTAENWVIPSSVREHGMNRTLYLSLAIGVVGLLSVCAVVIPWLRGRRVKNASATLWRGQVFAHEVPSAAA